MDEELDEFECISAINVKFRSSFFEVDVKSDETELSVLSICFWRESCERSKVNSPTS